MQLYHLRIQPGYDKRDGNSQLMMNAATKLVLGALAFTWRFAAEEELVFGLIHREPILPDLTRASQGSLKTWQV